MSRRVLRLRYLLVFVVLGGSVVFRPTVLPLPVRQLFGISVLPILPLTLETGPGQYAFEFHQPGSDRTPVGFDPCLPIRIQVNPSGGPPDAVALTKSVMHHVAAVSGLRFAYIGTTSARPTLTDGPRRFRVVAGPVSPVLVAWAQPDEVRAMKGDVVGSGGSVAVAGPGGRLRLITGEVVLDADFFAGLEGVPGGDDLGRSVMLHEFGHLVGLAHVRDKRQLMYPHTGRPDFEGGDRAGLIALSQLPCG